MSSPTSPSPRPTPNLPEEVLLMVATCLAASGSARSTVSAMTASRSFHSIFSSNLKCSKLTLDQSNYENALKGLCKPMPQWRYRPAATAQSLVTQRRPHKMRRYKRVAHVLINRVLPQRHRIKWISSSLRQHARTLSSCTHLSIDDFESLRGVVQACKTARTLGFFCLWQNVETLCLGPSLLWRLHYLEEDDVRVMREFVRMVDPSRLCLTVGLMGNITEFHQVRHRENGSGPNDHRLCVNLERQWEQDCYSSADQICGVLVGTWHNLQHVSIHNLYIQKLPEIGPPNLRVFWANSSSVDRKRIHEIADWLSLTKSKAEEIADFIANLSDSGETVEFGGSGCSCCPDGDQEHVRKMRVAVGEKLTEENLRIMRRCVTFTAEPDPCVACGKC